MAQISDLRNDWIYSLIFGIIGILSSSFFNIWIGLIFAIIAVFFGVSSIKAGSKLGYIGVLLTILIIINVVMHLFIWDYVSNIASVIY